MREAAPHDGRSHRLLLTDAGREITPRLAAIADRNDATFFDNVPAADRETLRRVLQEIVERRRIVDVALD